MLPALENRFTFPLFWCLKPEQQVQLVRYQLKTYGLRLEIPPAPGQGEYNLRLETPAELENIMKQAPHSPRRVA